MSAGDVVVHVNHGIARFVGLKTVSGAGLPARLLELHLRRRGQAVPAVENIELLSRYGGEDSEAPLTGSAAAHGRRARRSSRSASSTWPVGSSRSQRRGSCAKRRSSRPTTTPITTSWRASYDATEDQQHAIDAVLDDLAAGRPMDRLICGDVGFGKTEVALRAAYAAAMSASRWRWWCRRRCSRGSTTRLSRPLPRPAAQRGAGLAHGLRRRSRRREEGHRRRLGRHRRRHACRCSARRSGSMTRAPNRREEQHFGVAHKERLKELRAEVHVLTLSATPIPRTLQLALTGVRELSIIATPPVDRLAVRTFIAPFDPLIVREALLRERYRGGQSFYVRAADRGPGGRARLPRRAVPRSNTPSPRPDGADRARGGDGPVLRRQVRRAAVDDHRGVRPRYSARQHAHRAPVGHVRPRPALPAQGPASAAPKTRAYALLTLRREAHHPNAEKRLKVLLQSLDSLGAGFQLASHDLDIRGAGNLLGDEQSGHIKEVGFELYQQMLEEAVAKLKAGIEEPRGAVVAHHRHRQRPYSSPKLRGRPRPAHGPLPPPLCAGDGPPISRASRPS